MKRLAITIFLLALTSVGANAALLTYEDYVQLDVQLGDNHSNAVLYFEYSHYLDPIIPLGNIAYAELILHSQFVHQPVNPIYLEIYDGQGWNQVGFFLPNAGDGPGDTVITFDVQPPLSILFDALSPQGYFNVRLAVEWVHPEWGYEDMFVHHSTFKAHWDPLGPPEPNAVPEPGTVLLTLAGIASLVGLGKKKK